MALPPTHRVDHEPIYILPFDLAWDKDRIEADERAVKANALGPVTADPLAVCHWQKWSDHPVKKYATGDSRFDIATIEPWLKRDVEPTKFRLRRLDGAQYRAVQHLMSVGLRVDALHLALRYGLRSVVGLPGVEWPDREREPPADLTDHQLGMLTKVIGENWASVVGEAVWSASQTIFRIGEAGA
jgi:hypothetical protein